MVYCSPIMGAYVKSDSSGGRSEEATPGLRCSRADSASVNREPVSVWVDEGCVFLKRGWVGSVRAPVLN